MNGTSNFEKSTFKKKKELIRLMEFYMFFYGQCDSNCVSIINSMHK